MKFLPVLIVLASTTPDLARGQSLPFPGTWAGDADWVADGIRHFNWTAFGSGAAQSASITVSATGPGSVDFSYTLSESFNPANNGRITVTTGLGSTAFAHAITPSTGRVRLAAGPQTVTFTLSGSRPADAFSVDWSLGAWLYGVTLNPDPASLADALDTTVPVSGSGWVPAATGETDYARLTPNSSGTLTAQVTGPAVAVIAADIDYFGSGPSGGMATPTLSYQGPGSDGWRRLLSYSGVSPDGVFGFAVPAGIQTLSWSGTSAYTFFGSGISWRLDDLRILTPVDYQAALEGGSDWSWGGDVSNLPFPQTAITHDGVDAVRLCNSQRDFSAIPSSMSASFTGPGVVSYWWCSRQKDAFGMDNGSDANTLIVLRNGVLIPTPPAKRAWTKVWLNLPAGPQALTWQAGPAGQVTSADGFLDEVASEPRSPFQTWTAAQLGEARMDEPGILDPTADVDSDGRTNLMEYALQTSPADPGRQRDPEVVRDPANPSQALLTWRQSTLVTGVTLSPQVSTDLQNWLPLTAEEIGTSGTDRLMRAVLPAGNGRRYGRLLASQ